MPPDAPEPLEIGVVFERLRDQVKAFQSAFGQGLGGAQEAIDLWEKTCKMRGEWEQFYQFLLRYEAILVGLLWAHHPDVYREQVYPRLQDSSQQTGAPPNSQLPTNGQRPRNMLAVAEGIFTSRGNQPMLISQLIVRMQEEGVRFRAKDPAKSLAQAMRNSGRFETVRRGMYRMKE